MARGMGWAYGPWAGHERALQYTLSLSESVPVLQFRHGPPLGLTLPTGQRVQLSPVDLRESAALGGRVGGRAPSPTVARGLLFFGKRARCSNGVDQWRLRVEAG